LELVSILLLRFVVAPIFEKSIIGFCRS